VSFRFAGFAHVSGAAKQRRQLSGPSRQFFDVSKRFGVFGGMVDPSG
jgi:hypothetical protein